jgi:hypothetical protein
MKTIFKYRIQVTGTQIIKMPIEWRPLHVGIDPKGDFCLWALVDTDNLEIDQEIYVHGTGHNVGTDEEYIGSDVQGHFVWHVFRQI